MTVQAKRILLVEDEAAVGRLVKVAFERLALKNGHSVEVVWVLDAASGLSALQREGFDLVLTDNQLPDRSGVELISAIRQGATNTAAGTPPDIPIVLSSGGLPDSAEGSGYDAFVQKPYALQELVTTVFQLLHFG